MKKPFSIQNIIAIPLIFIVFLTNVVLVHSLEINLLPAPPIRHPGESQGPVIPLDSGIRQNDGSKSIPQAFGSIRKIIPGSSDKTIIHIQDVHMNEEAQKNIGSVIQYLIDHHQVDLIALEGMDGPIDIEAFRKFPDQNAVGRVADYLFRTQRLSGPMLTALKTKSPLPPIVGIDDEGHYNANIQAVKESYPQKEKLLLKFKAQDTELKTRSQKLMNPKLWTFHEKVLAYQDEKLTLGTYVETLLKTHESGHMTLNAFYEALQLERSLNFSQVEHERAILLKKLLAQLSESKTKELLHMSAVFKSGNLNHAEFYRYIEGLLKKYEINIDQLKAIRDYIQYVLLSDSIDGEKLQSEIRGREREVYERLAKTNEERELIQKTRWVYLQEKLVEFALTKNEWREYAQIKFSSPRQGGGQEGGSNSPTPGPSPMGRGTILGDVAFRSFEQFYVEAEFRDQKMATNIQLAIQKHKANVTVLVTGGFHSKGIQQYFSALELSSFNKDKVQKHKRTKAPTLISFIPKISQIDAVSGQKSLSVFTQQKTPLDRLFAGEKLFLPPRPIVLKSSIIPLIVLASHNIQKSVGQFGSYVMHMLSHERTGEILKVWLVPSVSMGVAILSLLLDWPPLATLFPIALSIIWFVSRGRFAVFVGTVVFYFGFNPITMVISDKERDFKEKSIEASRRLHNGFVAVRQISSRQYILEDYPDQTLVPEEVRGLGQIVLFKTIEDDPLYLGRQLKIWIDYGEPLRAEIMATVDDIAVHIDHVERDRSGNFKLDFSAPSIDLDVYTRFNQGVFYINKRTGKKIELKEIPLGQPYVVITKMTKGGERASLIKLKTKNKNPITVYGPFEWQGRIVHIYIDSEGKIERFHFPRVYDEKGYVINGEAELRNFEFNDKGRVKERKIFRQDELIQPLLSQYRRTGMLHMIYEPRYLVLKENNQPMHIHEAKSLLPMIPRLVIQLPKVVKSRKTEFDDQHINVPSSLANFPIKIFFEYGVVTHAVVFPHGLENPEKAIRLDWTEDENKGKPLLFPMGLIEKIRKENNGVLMLDKVMAGSFQMRIKGTDIYVPSFLQRKGEVEINWGKITSTQFNLRALHKQEVKREPKRQNHYHIPTQYMGRDLRVRLHDGKLTDFYIRNDIDDDWILIQFREYDNVRTRIIKSPGFDKPIIMTRPFGWRQNKEGSAERRRIRGAASLDRELPSTKAVGSFIANEDMDPVDYYFESIIIDDYDLVKDALGAYDLDVLLELFAGEEKSVEILSRMAPAYSDLRSFLLNVSERLISSELGQKPDLDGISVEKLTRRLLESIELSDEMLERQDESDRAPPPVFMVALALMDVFNRWKSREKTIIDENFKVKQPINNRIERNAGYKGVYGKIIRVLDAIEKKMPGSLSQIGVDSETYWDKMRFALQEFIRNSIDAGATRIRLRVYYRGQERNRIYIDITDNGNGFDPIVLEKVGKEVVSTVREKDKDNRAWGGAGLGLLYSVESMVEMGYSISFKNNNSGATISIQIQYDQNESEDDVSPKGSFPIHQPIKSKEIRNRVLQDGLSITNIFLNELAKTRLIYMEMKYGDNTIRSFMVGKLADFIENSIDAGATRVTLQAVIDKNEKNHLRVEVVDNGSGFDADSLEKAEKDMRKLGWRMIKENLNPGVRVGMSIPIETQKGNHISEFIMNNLGRIQLILSYSVAFGIGVALLAMVQLDDDENDKELSKSLDEIDEDLFGSQDSLERVKHWVKLWKPSNQEMTRDEKYGSGIIRYKLILLAAEGRYIEEINEEILYEGLKSENPIERNHALAVFNQKYKNEHDEKNEWARHHWGNPESVTMQSQVRIGTRFGVGTGFVMAEDSHYFYIMTNSHVVHNEDRVKIYERDLVEAPVNENDLLGTGFVLVRKPDIDKNLFVSKDAYDVAIIAIHKTPKMSLKPIPLWVNNISSREHPVIQSAYRQSGNDNTSFKIVVDNEQLNNLEGMLFVNDPDVDDGASGSPLIINHEGKPVVTGIITGSQVQRDSFQQILGKSGIGINLGRIHWDRLLNEFNLVSGVEGESEYYVSSHPELLKKALDAFKFLDEQKNRVERYGSDRIKNINTNSDDVKRMIRNFIIFMSAVIGLMFSFIIYVADDHYNEIGGQKYNQSVNIEYQKIKMAIDDLRNTLEVSEDKIRDSNEDPRGIRHSSWNNARELIQNAYKNLKNNNFDRANILYESAVVSYGSGWAGLALEAERLDRNNLVITYINKIYDLNTQAKARYQIAKLKEQKGDTDGAIYNLTQSLHLYNVGAGQNRSLVHLNGFFTSIDTIVELGEIDLGIEFLEKIKTKYINVNKIFLIDQKINELKELDNDKQGSFPWKILTTILLGMGIIRKQQMWVIPSRKNAEIDSRDDLLREKLNLFKKYMERGNQYWENLPNRDSIEKILMNTSLGATYDLTGGEVDEGMIRTYKPDYPDEPIMLIPLFVYWSKYNLFTAIESRDHTELKILTDIVSVLNGDEIEIDNTEYVKDSPLFDAWEEESWVGYVHDDQYKKEIHPLIANIVSMYIEEKKWKEPVLLDVLGGDGHFLEVLKSKLISIDPKIKPKFHLIDQVPYAGQELKDENKNVVIKDIHEIDSLKSITSNPVQLVFGIGALNGSVMTPKQAKRIANKIFDALEKGGFLILSGITALLLNKEDLDGIGFKVHNMVVPHYLMGREGTPMQLYIAEKRPRPFWMKFRDLPYKIQPSMGWIRYLASPWIDKNTEIRMKRDRVNILYERSLRHYGRMGREFILDQPSQSTLFMKRFLGPARFAADEIISFLINYLPFHKLFELIYKTGHDIFVWVWLRWWLQLEPSVKSHPKIIEKIRKRLRYAKTRSKREKIMKWHFRWRRGGYVWARSAMNAFFETDPNHVDRSHQNHLGIHERLVEPLADYLKSIVPGKGHLNDARDQEIFDFLLWVIGDRDNNQWTERIKELNMDVDINVQYPELLVKPAVRGIVSLMPYMNHMLRRKVIKIMFEDLTSDKSEVEISTMAKGLGYMQDSEALEDAIAILNAQKSATSTWVKEYWIQSNLLGSIEKLIHDLKVVKREYPGDFDDMVKSLLRRVAHRDNHIMIRVNSLRALAMILGGVDQSVLKTLMYILRSDTDGSVQHVGLYALAELQASTEDNLSKEEFIHFLIEYIQGKHLKRSSGPYRPNPVAIQFAKSLLKEQLKTTQNRDLIREIQQHMDTRPFWTKVFYVSFWTNNIKGILKWFLSLFKQPVYVNPVIFIDIKNNEKVGNVYDIDRLIHQIQVSLFRNGMTSLSTSNYYQKRSEAESRYIKGLLRPYRNLRIRFQNGLMSKNIRRLLLNLPALIQRRHRSSGNYERRMAYMATPIKEEPIVILGRKRENRQLQKVMGLTFPVLHLSTYVTESNEIDVEKLKSDIRSHSKVIQPQPRRNISTLLASLITVSLLPFLMGANEGSVMMILITIVIIFGLVYFIKNIPFTFALRFMRQKINYKKMLGKSRVLFMGESHDNILIRVHLHQHVKEMKKAGITHYVIEAPHHPKIDQLNQGMQVNLSGVKLGPNGGKYDAVWYRQVVMAMAKEGIKIVAIDWPNGNSSELKNTEEEFHEFREQYMADQILKILKRSPNIKIATLLGMRHVMIEIDPGRDSVATRVQNAGIEITRMRFVGGRESEGPILEDLTLSGIIRDLKMTDKNFMLQVNRYSENYNYLVHIDQLAEIPSLNSAFRNKPQLVPYPARTQMQHPQLKYETRMDQILYYKGNGWLVPDNKIPFNLVTDDQNYALDFDAVSEMSEANDFQKEYGRFKRHWRALFPNMKYVRVLPRGADAERILSEVYVSGGREVLGTLHYEPAEGHVVNMGGSFDSMNEFMSNLNINDKFGFIGDPDFDIIKRYFEKGKVAYILIMATNNEAAGQPVRPETIEKIKQLRDEIAPDVPIILDAARVWDNAQLLKERKGGYRQKTIQEIVTELVQHVDGMVISAKKNIRGRGGILAFNRKSPRFRYFQDAIVNNRRLRMSLDDRHNGLSAVDMAQLRYGLDHVANDEENEIQSQLIQRLWLQLYRAGVPLVSFPGGHGIFIDAKEFFKYQIENGDFGNPAITLNILLYLVGGILGSEFGEAGKNTHFFRLAFGRQKWTEADIDYIADVIIYVYRNREKIQKLAVQLKNNQVRINNTGEKELFAGEYQLPQWDSSLYFKDDLMRKAPKQRRIIVDQSMTSDESLHNIFNGTESAAAWIPAAQGSRAFYIMLKTLRSVFKFKNDNLYGSPSLNQTHIILDQWIKNKIGHDSYKVFIDTPNDFEKEFYGDKAVQLDQGMKASKSNETIAYILLRSPPRNWKEVSRYANKNKIPIIIDLSLLFQRKKDMSLNFINSADVVFSHEFRDTPAGFIVFPRLVNGQFNAAIDLHGGYRSSQNVSPDSYIKISRQTSFLNFKDDIEVKYREILSALRKKLNSAYNEFQTELIIGQIWTEKNSFGVKIGQINTWVLLLADIVLRLHLSHRDHVRLRKLLEMAYYEADFSNAIAPQIQNKNDIDRFYADRLENREDIEEPLHPKNALAQTQKFEPAQYKLIHWNKNERLSRNGTIRIVYPDVLSKAGHPFEAYLEYRPVNNVMLINVIQTDNHDELQSEEHRREVGDWNEKLVKEAIRIAREAQFDSVMITPFYVQYAMWGFENKPSSYVGYKHYTQLPFRMGFRLTVRSRSWFHRIFNNMYGYLVWEYPIQQKTEIIDHIGDRDVVYTKTESFEDIAEVTFDSIEPYINYQKFKRVLIVGANAKEVEEILRRSPHADIDVIDISMEQLKKLRSHFDGQNEKLKRIRLHHADASNLNPETFKNESYDFIFSLGIDRSAFFPESLHRVDEILAEIAKWEVRLLKPGGFIFHLMNSEADYFEEYIGQDGFDPVPETLGLYHKSLDMFDNKFIVIEDNIIKEVKIFFVIVAVIILGILSFIYWILLTDSEPFSQLNQITMSILIVAVLGGVNKLKKAGYGKFLVMMALLPFLVGANAVDGTMNWKFILEDIIAYPLIAFTTYFVSQAFWIFTNHLILPRGLKNLKFNHPFFIISMGGILMGYFFIGSYQIFITVAIMVYFSRPLAYFIFTKPMSQFIKSVSISYFSSIFFLFTLLTLLVAKNGFLSGPYEVFSILVIPYIDLGYRMMKIRGRRTEALAVLNQIHSKVSDIKKNKNNSDRKGHVVFYALMLALAWELIMIGWLALSGWLSIDTLKISILLSGITFGMATSKKLNTNDLARIDWFYEELLEYEKVMKEVELGDRDPNDNEIKKMATELVEAYFGDVRKILLKYENTLNPLIVDTLNVLNRLGINLNSLSPSEFKRKWDALGRTKMLHLEPRRLVGKMLFNIPTFGIAEYIQNLPIKIPYPHQGMFIFEIQRLGRLFLLSIHGLGSKSFEVGRYFISQGRKIEKVPTMSGEAITRESLALFNRIRLEIDTRQKLGPSEDRNKNLMGFHADAQRLVTIALTNNHKDVVRHLVEFLSSVNLPIGIQPHDEFQKKYYELMVAEDPAPLLEKMNGKSFVYVMGAHNQFYLHRTEAIVTTHRYFNRQILMTRVEKSPDGVYTLNIYRAGHEPRLFLRLYWNPKTQLFEGSNKLIDIEDGRSIRIHEDAIPSHIAQTDLRKARYSQEEALHLLQLHKREYGRQLLERLHARGLLTWANGDLTRDELLILLRMSQELIHEDYTVAHLVYHMMGKDTITPRVIRRSSKRYTQLMSFLGKKNKKLYLSTSPKSKRGILLSREDAIFIWAERLFLQLMEKRVSTQKIGTIIGVRHPRVGQVVNATPQTKSGHQIWVKYGQETYFRLEKLEQWVQELYNSDEKLPRHPAFLRLTLKKLLTQHLEDGPALLPHEAMALLGLGYQYERRFRNNIQMTRDRKPLWINKRGYVYYLKGNLMQWHKELLSPTVSDPFKNHYHITRLGRTVIQLLLSDEIKKFGLIINQGQAMNMMGLSWPRYHSIIKYFNSNRYPLVIYRYGHPFFIFKNVKKLISVLKQANPEDFETVTEEKIVRTVQKKLKKRSRRKSVGRRGQRRGLAPLDIAASLFVSSLISIISMGALKSEEVHHDYDTISRNINGQPEELGLEQGKAPSPVPFEFPDPRDTESRKLFDRQRYYGFRRAA